MSNNDIFSTAWAQDFGQAWNFEPSVVEPLERAGFNACIGYGFIGDAQPLMVIHIQGGAHHQCGGSGR